MLVCCHNSQKTGVITVSVDPDQAQTTDLTDSAAIRYTQLENVSDAYFKNISDILWSRDTIVVLGSGKISAFDRNGKYLFDYAQKGEGPMEFTSLRSIFLKDRILYLYDNISHRMLSFTLSGNFVDQTRVSGAGYNSTLILPFPSSENYIGLTTFQGTPGAQTPLFLRYNSHFEKTKESDELIETSFINPAFPLIASGQGFLYNPVWSRDIFFVDQNIEPSLVYTVDFGKYAIPDYIYEKGAQNVVQAIREKNKDVIDKCYIGYMADTPSHFFFTCYREGVKIVSYDKADGTTKVFAPQFRDGLTPWCFLKS